MRCIGVAVRMPSPSVRGRGTRPGEWTESPVRPSRAAPGRDRRLRHGTETPVMPSPGMPGRDRRLRRSIEPPAFAPRFVSAVRAPTAIRLTFGQPLTNSVLASPWSVRPCESAPLTPLVAHPLPGSHGPSEAILNNPKVDFRLTPQSQAAGRDFTGRERAGPSRPRRPQRPRSDPERDKVVEKATGGAGIGPVLGPARGAPRWRPPVS